MLDTFASLGVSAFDLTRTDMDGRKRSFRAAQSGEALRRWMPSLMESAAHYRDNLIVRPRDAAAELVQLDDLSAAMLEPLSSYAFLILRTSVGNYQAWLAVRGCGSDVARRLRRASGADPSASGAARLAGSMNFKRKYAPRFPTVVLRKAIPERIVMGSELATLGWVSAPDPIPAIRPDPVCSPWSAKIWPSYERCLQNAPPAHHCDRPDVSRADFTFCLLAIDWGWSIEDTFKRLLEKSSKAQQKGEAYARRTAQNAAAVIDRRSRVRVPNPKPEVGSEFSCMRFEGMLNNGNGVFTDRQKV
jgi:hypothetical protein